MKSQRPALLESLNCDASFSISSGVGGGITGLPIDADIAASVALRLAVASWGDSVEWSVLLGFIITPSLVCNIMPSQTKCQQWNYSNHPHHSSSI